MHSEPMSELDGKFTSKNKMSSPCPKCKSDEYYWELWESDCGGFEDEKQSCRDCGYTHWIDGIDS